MTFKDWLKISYYKDKDPLLITAITCSYQGLTNLKGIEQFKNLKVLYCSWNNLTSLKGVKKLTKLKTLYCQDNLLISVKEIINLNELKHLYCYSNFLEHKYYYNYNSVKEYQKYLKSFYRKNKIKNII